MRRQVRHVTARVRIPDWSQSTVYPDVDVTESDSGGLTITTTGAAEHQAWYASGMWANVEFSPASDSERSFPSSSKQ